MLQMGTLRDKKDAFGHRRSARLSRPCGSTRPFPWRKYRTENQMIITQLHLWDGLDFLTTKAPVSGLHFNCHQKWTKLHPVFCCDHCVWLQLVLKVIPQPIAWNSCLIPDCQWPPPIRPAHTQPWWSLVSCVQLSSSLLCLRMTAYWRRSTSATTLRRDVRKQTPLSSSCSKCWDKAPTGRWQLSPPQMQEYRHLLTERTSRLDSKCCALEFPGCLDHTFQHYYKN